MQIPQDIKDLMEERLGSSWYEQLEHFIESSEFVIMRNRLISESIDNIVYPEPKIAYRAFSLCNFKNTKVVILGQDPYHDGNANGLAFSTDGNLTPSLRVIHSALSKEYNIPWWRGSDFSDLADQGVLLLNTALSVVKGKAGSHLSIWKEFTKAVITCLLSKENLIWMLWGKEALDAVKSVGNIPYGHVLLHTVHPAAIKHNPNLVFEPGFLRANEILESWNLKPILWVDFRDDLPF